MAIGYALVWAELLLTSTYGQVCYEERVEQTQLHGREGKDLIWLLFEVPPDLEFQPGRANAACGRTHRILSSALQHR